jgi:hypothetical protein
MLIDARRLEEILKECLWDDADAPPMKQMPIYRGVITNFSFDPRKVDKHREQITKWLEALPAEFHLNTGGGMSFLAACMDRNGQQWGEHRNMEMLFVLGEATGQVRCPFPRSFWGVLPGGMPYYIVNTSGIWPDDAKKEDADASQGP